MIGRSRALRNGFSDDGPGTFFEEAAARFDKSTVEWVNRANGTQDTGKIKWYKRWSPLHNKSAMNALPGPNGFGVALQGNIQDLKKLRVALAELEKGIKERIESDLVDAPPGNLPDHVVENALRVCILQHWQEMGLTQPFRRRRLTDDNLKGSISDKIKKLGPALLPADGRAAMRPLNARLLAWLAEKNMEVVPNNGGSDAVNCLLISILQHASGNYGDPDAAAAATYRKQLPSLGAGTLYADTGAVEEYVAIMNRDYGADMRVVVVQAQEGGKPYVLQEVGAGANPVVVWHQGAHYEAVRMRG